MPRYEHSAHKIEPQSIQEMANELPNTDEEILRCLDSTVLEDQPTEVLIQLAEKLKERRTDIYPEEEN